MKLCEDPQIRLKNIFAREQGVKPTDARALHNAWLQPSSCFNNAELDPTCAIQEMPNICLHSSKVSASFKVATSTVYSQCILLISLQMTRVLCAVR